MRRTLAIFILMICAPFVFTAPRQSLAAQPSLSGRDSTSSGADALARSLPAHDGQTASASNCQVDFHTKVHASALHPVRSFRLSVDSNCTPVISEVTAPSSPAASMPGGIVVTAAPGGAAANQATVSPDSVFPPQGTRTAVCVAIQTLRDPIGIPETEIRNKQTWTWDGNWVVAASVGTYAVPGKTGWNVTGATADYFGQYVPASALQAFATASFDWQIFHFYPHTHEANTVVYGDGGCDGEFGFTGEMPGNDSYLTFDIHIE